MTLSISERNAKKDAIILARSIRRGWGISLFLMLFGGIYEYFSHEVYSPFMVYAFAFPLIGIVFAFSVIKTRGMAGPRGMAKHVYEAGIACLTVGSVMEGILAIYGTTNNLTVWYWIVGGVMTVLGLLLYLFQKK